MGPSLIGLWVYLPAFGWSRNAGKVGVAMAKDAEKERIIAGESKCRVRPATMFLGTARLSFIGQKEIRYARRAFLKTGVYMYKAAQATRPPRLMFVDV